VEFSVSQGMREGLSAWGVVPRTPGHSSGNPYGRARHSVREALLVLSKRRMTFIPKVKG